MIFRYYPYVWLNAEKGSGKTLLMEVPSSITFNGELITNPTESVIFRDISNNLITMFIDEVEHLRKRDKDNYGSLISLLNAGFNRSGVVKRTENTGKGHIVKKYNAYSPKMFAGINEIDDVLQDRTIKIPILRKKDSEPLERYKETPEILELQRSIRDDLYIFALSYANIIADLYYKEGDDNILGIVNHLNNRELDIWEPIFLIAYIIDVESDSTKLIKMMEQLSQKSTEEKQTDSITQNETFKLLTLLKDMQNYVLPISENGDIRIFEAEKVFEYFKENEDYNWIERTNSLTRKLKKINVKSDQKSIEGEKKRVYIMNVKKFEDLCERYNI